MSLSTIRESRANRFFDLVVKQDNAISLLIKTYGDWSINREIALFELSSLAKDLDLLHKNVNITTLLGTSVSAIGGSAAMAGLLLAPATGGLSTVMVLGVAAGLAGGVTAVGSTLAEIGITRVRCKKIQCYLDIDKCLTEKLIRDVDVLVSESSHLEYFIKGTHFSHYDLLQIAEEANYLIKIKKIGKSGLKSIQQFLKNPEVEKMYRKIKGMKKYSHVFEKLKSQLPKIPELEDLTASIKGIFKNPRCMSRVTKVGFLGLTSLAVVVDIWCIVQTAQDMRKGSKSVVANKIREVISKLEGGLYNIEKLVIKLV